MLNLCSAISPIDEGKDFGDHKQIAEDTGNHQDHKVCQLVARRRTVTRHHELVF